MAKKRIFEIMTPIGHTLDYHDHIMKIIYLHVGEESSLLNPKFLS